MTSLDQITTKLLDLNDKYASVYPKFVLVELRYTAKYDKFMLEAMNQFTSQQGRDSATRERMRQEPEYEEYHTLLAEVKVIEFQSRSLQQASKNLINRSWETIKSEVGDFNG